MKNIPWKKIFIVLLLGFGAYALYAIYQAFKSGERTIAGLVTAPFKALSTVWGAVSSGASSAASAIANSTPVQGVEALASLDSLTQTSAQLTAQNQALATNAYAPGGATYNQIAATRGTAAADAAWAQVQADYAAQNQVDAANSSWFGLGSLFN